jgi:hypothetical protein
MEVAHSAETFITSTMGRTIAQAVSRRLPNVAARVRARVMSCGICGVQSGTGAGFLRVFQFPLPIRIPPIALQSSFIIWGWYSKPNGGRSTKWTQSHPMRDGGGATSTIPEDSNLHSDCLKNKCHMDSPI